MNIMTPETEIELVEILEQAAGPLWIQGGGTRGLPGGEQVVKTTALAGIRLYEPGALTMVAGAGTPLEEVEAALEAEGQMLAFEPYSLNAVTDAQGRSTIGGVFATNASGARRVQAGAARDFLLGVRFVDGAGRAIKNGGRVMKNVTGYDLVKLMAGSYGTLGILTEVSFKVLPKPEAVAQVQLHALSDAQAIGALSKALGSPFDVSGAMHIPASLETEARTAIRVEGFAASVAYRAEKLRMLWSEFGNAEISDGPEDWDRARGLRMFSPAARGAQGALWRLAVKPSDAPAVMGRITADHDVVYAYDWGGGRIWVWAPAARAGLVHAALQAEAAAVAGHATLVHTSHPIDAPRFQPEPSGVARLSAGLRAKFDPRGILNQGLMA